ncbi:RNA polymerase sigma factor SigF [Streptomyces sp. NBC_00582]|uniref:RNA polymerase sigma factor SigF n=1 Tax=Streptomyces sp. NBC_00582 TaxID=2975783 RepID=UPI0010644448|nr:SigB/SigF/SigG family RNA polymerase sigma factor [Streptomyces sp. NBC_00582]WUB62019.1 SigB/SigF/SigG family RNA polymerase sigma factor [Streptomyces sp. NBC_00582]
MRNGDGPVRDEERGTRELPAENDSVSPGGSRRMTADGIDGIDGIPEQARPHPEDDTGRQDRSAVQDSPREGRIGGSPGRAEDRARQRATGGTMSEHERDDEHGVPGTQHEPRDQREPRNQHEPREQADRSGARAMFVQLRGLQDGSPEYAELRNQLVRMHLPLVEHLARRFRNRGEPLDDLTQVATIGLIKSVDRFDPDRGVEFSTYATPTVVGEIKRHFRDKGWAVRVPRRLQELRLALTTATAELSQQHGRSPTVHELAEKLAISEEEVLEGLESANAYSTLSLDVPDTDDESPAVADTLGAEDEALEGVEYRESLKPLLEDLPPREKRILLLRFFGNMTQSQIAQEVGISQMHVSRLLARTLAQLREKLLVEE